MPRLVWSVCGRCPRPGAIRSSRPRGESMSTVPRRPSATVVRAARPRAAFLAILSGLLMLGGLSAPPAVATGPATTVTVLTLGSGSPVVGQTLVLRAAVTAAGQPVPVGHVTFDAAPTEDALW